MSLWMAVWFASGAVMTFAEYPAYTDAERLATAPRLPALGVGVPEELRAWIARGGLGSGTRARLAQLEGEPTWVFTDGDRRRALRAADRHEYSGADATVPRVRPTADVPLLDSGRARAELERRVGRCAADVSQLAVADQWTVGACDQRVGAPAAFAKGDPRSCPHDTAPPATVIPDAGVRCVLDADTSYLDPGAEGASRCRCAQPMLSE